MLSFLEALDLTDVVLVGSDTGGAVSQFVLDEDASRIGALVLTNCDAFDVFPPFPFDCCSGSAGTRARRGRCSRRCARRRCATAGSGSAGWSTGSSTADESRAWVTPYLTDAGVRRDVTAFARAWRAEDLADVATRLPAFDKPVLLCWAPADPFFKVGWPPVGRDVPGRPAGGVRDAMTFVSLDQPARLAEEILAWLGDAAA